MSTQQTNDQNIETIAFFDFDGTLTTKDTLMPFLKYVVGKPTYYFKLLVISPVLVAYFLKLVRNDVAKQLVLRWYLAGYSIDELRDYGNKFVTTKISGMLRKQGMERFYYHKTRGHKCIILSASLDIYLQSWSEINGFDGLECSKLFVDKDGTVNGTLDGFNCYGREKCSRMVNHKTQSLRTITYGYGDTSGDLPFLNIVDHGFFLKDKEFVPLHDNPK